MTQNDTPFRWTGKAEQAAQLAADDRLDDEAIAARCGVSRASISRWRRHGEFRARIAEHLEAQRAAIRTEGIANKQNRIAILQAEMDAMQELRAARRAAGIAQAAADRRRHAEAHPADEFIPDAPGIETGLLVRQETPTRYGTTVEWAFDRALQDEQRATLKQVAQETGQWEERSHETHGADESLLAALRAFNHDDGGGTRD